MFMDAKRIPRRKKRKNRAVFTGACKWGEFLKLLHLCSYYCGRPALYNNLFQALEAAGELRNEMYAPVHKGAGLDEIPKNDKILISPCFDRWNRVFFHLKHRRILRDVQEKLEITAYDLLHAHTLFSNGYIARRLHQKYGVPYTVTVQNTDIYTFFKKMPHLRTMGRKILNEASAVFFISAPHCEETLSKYVREADREAVRKKSYIVPLGVDDFWFRNPSAGKTLGGPPAFSVLYAGEITRNKNIPVLAEAVKLLNEKGRQGRLTVVGNVVDPSEERRLLTYPFVTMHPRLPKEELLERYRENDIFALVSKRETFGLVCAEAMTQGLPVLYTRGQGFDRQFPEGEIGFPVDCRRAEEIAEAMERVIQNYDELSRRCVALCGKFEWKKVAAEYQTVFLSLKE